MMMVVMTRVLMPVVMMVGFYVFLRGHNEPGGGFIAGLIVSIGLVMQYMASGYSWATARQRYPHQGVIGAGVLIAGLTGIGSWFVGKPFLTSDFTYVRIPPFEKFELATAALFDLGVFLGCGWCGDAVARRVQRALHGVRMCVTAIIRWTSTPRAPKTEALTEQGA